MIDLTRLARAPEHPALPVERLRRECAPDSFRFETTEELEATRDIIGQDRALRAIQLGLEMDSPGYNIFLAGFVGTGRNTTIRQVLQRLDHNRRAPDDLCYVYNFAKPEEPAAHAPSSFLLAAFVMVFSAATFAEFVGRIPKCAGEAIYVEAGFGWTWLKLATGGLVVFSAAVAAAAISVGCAGYVAELVGLPLKLLTVLVVLAMGVIAAWGVQESVTFAGILTVIEILGLVVIVVAGIWAEPAMFTRIGTALPDLGDGAAFQGVIAAGLIAFFAFIGFDDVVNLAEETPEPRRTMPLAIVISLALVTVIYFLVAFVAVQTVPVGELAASVAPIGLLFERLTGLSPVAITLIAIFATANGIVIQLIMASRVLYGLFSGRPGLLGQLGQVDPRTRTPLKATIVVTAVVVAFAVLVPLDRLAETTSQIILVVFALVNVALVLVKAREATPPDGIFRVPMAVPVVGAVTCLALLFAPLLVG